MDDELAVVGRFLWALTEEAAEGETAAEAGV